MHRRRCAPSPGEARYTGDVLRFLSLVGFALVLGIGGCDKGSSTVQPRTDGRYVVTRDTPFYDSGCQQARLPDGKLKKKTPFTLLSVRGECWNIKLDDEDETYIQPTDVRAE